MPLKYRIAATVFSCQTLLIAVLLWVTVTDAQRSLGEQNRVGEEVILKLIGDLSRSSLLTEDYAELQSFIAAAVRHPRIENAILADVHGHVVVSTIPGLVGRPPPRLVDHDEHYWQIRDVRGFSTRLGTLALEFSNRAVLGLYRDIRRRALLVAAIGTIVIAVAGIVLAALLTRRLERLARAAEAVADGEPLSPVALAGTDEVARLARAFAGVVDRLQDNLAQLRRTRDHLIEPTEAMTQGFAVWDPSDRLVLCNQRFRELFGGLVDDADYRLRYREFYTRLYLRVLDRDRHGRGDDDPPAASRWIADCLERRRRSESADELRLRDGRTIDVREARTADGGTVGIYTDVTAEKRREQALQDSETRLRTIMAAVSDAIIAVDADGCVRSVNPAVERLFGWSPASLIGRPIGTLLLADNQIDGRTTRIAWTRAELRESPEQPPLELIGMRHAGDTFPVEVCVSSTILGSEPTFICTVRDISERKAVEDQILFHATHDPLTGIPNRSHFARRLDEAIGDACRRGETLAVMFLDLDCFKHVNDTFGHLVGDALLVAVARRLRRNLRASDIVARMGGDEFNFLLRNIGDPGAALKIGHKIVEAMQSPFLVQGHDLSVTATVGISLCPQHGETSETLLQHADAALYQAKAMGKNQVRLFVAGASLDQPAFAPRVQADFSRNRASALVAAFPSAAGPGRRAAHRR
jgi:diguanylate cyclase (GGDEF)-like protein/PAS domain S-box-containing protein